MYRAALLIVPLLTAPAVADQLFGTDPLTEKGDLAAKMVKGIDAYLMRELDKAPTAPKRLDRTRLREVLGMAGWSGYSAEAEAISGMPEPVKIAETDKYTVFTIRWAALPKIDGEGLLIEPKAKAVSQVIAIPDADQTPEDIVGLTDKVPAVKQFARLIAEQNIRVIVPALINRKHELSASPVIGRSSTQPHREFLYRMAYEMGRHLIGYEVQRVIAAEDYLHRRDGQLPVGVIGYGEGAVIALYAAAVDPMIKSVVSIGYAGPLSSMWKEPIDRNVWGILREYGVVGFWELLHQPAVCIGYNDDFKLVGRVPNSGTGLGATPGDIAPLQKADVEDLWRQLEPDLAKQKQVPLTGSKDDPRPVQYVDHTNVKEGMERTIGHLMAGLNLADKPVFTDKPVMPKLVKDIPPPDYRQKRLFTQILDHVQAEWRESEPTRWERFAKLDYSSRNAYVKTVEPVRQYFHEEVIGKLPEPTEKMNPKARQIYDTPKWTGYEVTIDVYPDVFAYGILLIPKGMKPLEKRPVVVCQHGLEGRPTDVCDPTKKTAYYNSFGAQLADLGYVAFAPQNPYIGRDDFRVLQRKANPLKLSLFSFIVRQHERILEWLPMIPQVDGNNIGFYGLSYGGKTAMRVPAILTKYKYSICSGDFNEWIGKNVSLLYKNSYMFTGEYEMYEFNLGKTFNYAEMAYLIAPRPFMVERGHDDGVGIDEMVSYEFAKVRYHYAKRLGIGDRTKIEYFVGGHEIHGEGTFDFIKEHSGWPAK